MSVAELKEITAYQCTCGKSYTTKSVALTCCTEKHCDCGAKIDKTQWQCKKCKDGADQLKWECAERRSATCDEVLYSEQLGNFIQYDIECFIDGLNLEEEEYQELSKLPYSEVARKFRIYICESKIPKPLNLNEEYEDFCFEDQELPGDWELAEEAIENWINSVPANMWPQYPTKIAWNGAIAEDEENNGN
jgi:hypothetical protein